MDSYTFDKLLLLLLRKIYAKYFGVYNLGKLPQEVQPNRASDIIYSHLISDKPCMISRFGAVEISAITNYLGTQNKHRNILDFIIGKQPEWWWNKGILRVMKDNAGFFPPTESNLNSFSELMIEDMKYLDVLGSWQKDEIRFINNFPLASIIHFVLLDPYWSEKPWTRALKDKKVLVVHPFDKEIQFQYRTNRTKLFNNEEVLPYFELKTFKSVQSIGGTHQFNSWFDALKYMKNEIDEIEYDVCLLGCGAYGLPLAAHIKRKGKKAVHIGGTLQLLFGIKGRRWENPSYVKDFFGEEGRYLKLFNDYWIRPGETSQILGAEKVEGFCYW